MKYIYYIVKLLKQMMGLPIYLASFAFPRNDEVWVFGEWHGKRYADNAKYLFEYVSEHYKNIRAVWISKDTCIISQIQNSGFDACHSYSWRGIKVALRAGVHFITHDAGDTNEFLSGGSLLVNLTHGTPLKRIGDDARYKRLGVLTTVFDRYAAKLFPRKRRFDIVSCADGEAAVRFSSAFPSTKKVVGLGYPRWDGLVGRCGPLPIDDQIRKFSHVISYLPTVRFCNQVPYDPFSVNGLNEFVDYLQKNNILLIVRTHPTASFDDNMPDNGNVMLVTSLQVPDTCDILKRTDLLITDYSSVMFDYAKLGRPTLLLAPDRDIYLREDVGIYGDYSTDSLGPIFDDWGQLCSYLKDRPTLLDRSEGAPDFIEGMASRRTVEYVQRAVGAAEVEAV